MDAAPLRAKPDARQVKSGRALRAALLALLEVKPLDQITIREIAAEAGIHYTTFFRHHATKEALLDHLAADQIDRLVALTMPVLDAADGRAAVGALFGYVAENRRLWTTLLTGGAANAMREEWLRLSHAIAATREGAVDWMPLDLAVTCSVGLVFDTIAWWLGQPEGTVPIDGIADILHRLLSWTQAQPVGARA